MKASVRAVVIGGGVVGASTLYHLAKIGWTDVMLIEKSELTSGSTWHAAGQCPSITGSYNLAKLHAYSNALYPRLEALTGQYTSWHASGGLRFANNPAELAWLKYILGFSRSIGFRMDIVGIDETDPGKHYVSWISPVARALIKAREGDTVNLHTPAGDEEIEILEVRYEEIPMTPFRPMKSNWTPNAR